MNLSKFPATRLITPPSRQHGTSLLEVLITILVIAFGLLGLAGLQATSLKNNNTAYYRSQATMAVYDVVDRMRANRPAALLGNYNIAIGSTPSGSSVASTDLIEWKQNIAQAIPAGNGSISVDINGNVTIVIQWDGDGDGVVTANNGKDTQFTTQTRL
jgi:type IV pilus assembly protein PilV